MTDDILDDKHPVYQMVESIIKKSFDELACGELDVDATLTMLARQIKVARDANHYLLLGRVYHAMGLITGERGRYQESLDYFQSALEAYQLTENQNRIALVLCCLGEIHRYQNHLEFASDYFKESRELSETIEDTHMVMYNYCNEGLLWIGNGAVERGISMIEEGLERAAYDNSFDKPIIFSLIPEMRIGLAEGYARLGRFKQAWEQVAVAVQLAHEKEMLRQVAFGYQVMALIAELEGKESDDIEQFFAESYRYWQKLNDLQELGKVSALEGDYWMSIGEKERAIGHYYLSVEHYENMGNVAAANQVRGKIEVAA